MHCFNKPQRKRFLVRVTMPFDFEIFFIFEEIAKLYAIIFYCIISDFDYMTHSNNQGRGQRRSLCVGNM